MDENTRRIDLVDREEKGTPLRVGSVHSHISIKDTEHGPLVGMSGKLFNLGMLEDLIKEAKKTPEPKKIETIAFRDREGKTYRMSYDFDYDSETEYTLTAPCGDKFTFQDEQMKFLADFINASYKDLQKLKKEREAKAKKEKEAQHIGVDLAKVDTVRITHKFTSPFPSVSASLAASNWVSSPTA